MMKLSPIFLGLALAFGAVPAMSQTNPPTTDQTTDQAANDNCSNPDPNAPPAVAGDQTNNNDECIEVPVVSDATNFVPFIGPALGGLALIGLLGGGGGGNGTTGTTSTTGTN